MFQIILCRIFPVQFLLITSMQSKLKSFTKLAHESENRDQNTLGSATFNLCHPDISLMTERELRDT